MDILPYARTRRGDRAPGRFPISVPSLLITSSIPRWMKCEKYPRNGVTRPQKSEYSTTPVSSIGQIVLLPIKSRSPHGIVVSAAGEYFSHRLTTALRGERTEKILSATQQKKLLHRIRVSVSRNRRGRSDGSISVQRRIGSLQVPQAATPPPVNGHPGRRPVGRYRRQRRSFSHSGDSQSISTSKPSSDSAFIRVLSWGRWLLSIWIFF